jgi:hypothetical protein
MFFLASRAALDRKLIILGDQPHSKYVFINFKAYEIYTLYAIVLRILYS